MGLGFSDTSSSLTTSLVSGSGSGLASAISGSDSGSGLASTTLGSGSASVGSSTTLTSSVVDGSLISITVSIGSSMTAIDSTFTGVVSISISTGVSTVILSISDT